MSVGLMFPLVYNEVQWALKYLRFTQSVVILTLQVLQFSNAAGCIPKNTYLYTSTANIFGVLSKLNTSQPLPFSVIWDTCNWNSYKKRVNDERKQGSKESESVEGSLKM